MYLLRATLAVSLFVLSFALVAPGQNPSRDQAKDQPKDQDQTIRVTTNLIEVRAVVTDRKGSAVPGLRREDFEIIENKDAQEIEFFSAVRVGASVENAVVSEAGPENAPPAARRPGPAASPARTVVLFVDNLHQTDANMLFAKQALKKFIAEKLTDDDMVALVTSGGTLGLFSQFTRDRRLLGYAVDKIGPRGANPNTLFTPYLSGQVEQGIPDAMNFAIQVLATEELLSGPRQMMESIARGRARQVLAGATYQRTATLATLRAVIDRLATMPGQRLIAMLSDGFTLQDRGGSFDTFSVQAVTSRAAAAGVVIYTIDSKGLDAAAVADASRPGMAASHLVQRFLDGERHDSRQVMNALAHDTGGDYFRNSNDLVAGIQRTLDDNNVYYVLGYYPANEDDPKRFRKLSVRVRNHPEYKVRATQGYMPSAIAKAAAAAEARTPAERLRQAIVSPLPKTEIGVFATADYIETEADQSQVTLQVYIDGAQLQYKEDAGNRSFNVDFHAMVFNSAGERVASTEKGVRSALPQAGYEHGLEIGYRYVTRLGLKPGFYQVRVAVREPDTERIGTTSAWVEVPDLKRKKLALSNILLTDAESLDHVTQLGKENVSFQVGTRQGIRVYNKRQMLGYYMRVYNPGKTELMYRTEIAQGDKVIAQTEWKPVAGAGSVSAKGIELGRMLPLAEIEPGLYELRLSFREGSSKKVTERTAAFEVVR
ncbi:MAG: VWA domain-containing protein [Acidobacteria bacterium]|nr:VWA domain-containing protein [Acidobacteriota bacterium]